MFFFSKKNKEEVLAVFDIGSGSVGGAILLASKDKKPIIISSFRKSFKLKDKVSIVSLEKEMLEILQDVAVSLQKDIHKTPDKVYAVLSSPWSSAALRSIKRVQSEGFTFTKNHAKDLIKEEVLKFKKENKGLDEIIDKRVINVLLNGYEVASPYGKKTKEAEMQIFLSLSSHDIVEKIEDTIMRTYERKIEFTSQMFADFIVVRDMFDRLNDFIILNIDEETTEVSIMRNDFLVGTASFPYGKNTFIRQISKSLNKSISEASSLLSAYKDGHLDYSYMEKIDIAIKEESKAWTNSLKMIFRGLFVDLIIPDNIFLTTDESSEKWFMSLLNKNSFPEFTTSGESFNVILSSGKNLRDFCDTSMNVKNDVNIMMQSIFINKINFK